ATQSPGSRRWGRAGGGRRSSWRTGDNTVGATRDAAPPPRTVSRAARGRTGAAEGARTRRADPGQDRGRGAGEVAAHPVDQSHLGARHLPLATLAAKLLDCLDQEKHAEHPRVGVGEATAGGVEREVATRRRALPGHEVAT